MIVSNTTLGRLEGLISTLFNGLALFCIKASPYSAKEVIFFRGIINVVILYCQATINKDDLFVGWQTIRKCLTRGLYGMISVYFMVLSNKRLSLSVHTVLGSLNVFVVILMNTIHLGNRLKIISVFMAVTAIIGVLLVIQPGVFGLGSVDGKGLDLKWTITEFLGLLASGCYILSSSMARVYTANISKEVGMVQNVFYLNLCLTLLSAILIILEPIQYPLMSMTEVIGVAVFAYLFQVVNDDAMKREPDTAIIAILQNKVILVSLCLDVMFLGSSVSLPNLIGIASIVVSTAACIACK